ncbi:MAG: hypothetical protein HYS22_03365 [Deltaproteobacteria bacterium]|nr:hypothetical protein [Deltaproteobacteria bacterium]
MAGPGEVRGSATSYERVEGISGWLCEKWGMTLYGFGQTPQTEQCIEVDGNRILVEKVPAGDTYTEIPPSSEASKQGPAFEARATGAPAVWGCACAPETIPPPEKSGRKISNNSQPNFTPSMVWTGKEFAVVWISGVKDDHYEDHYAEHYEDYYHVDFARIDAQGNKIIRRDLSTEGNPAKDDLQLTDSEGVMISSAILLWAGDGYSLIWGEYTRLEDNITKLYFMPFRIDGRGNIMDEPGLGYPAHKVLVSKSGKTSGVSAVMIDPSQYGISWSSEGEGLDRGGALQNYHSLYFVLTSGSGRRIHYDERLTPIAQSTEDLGPPSLVWNGTDFALSWAEEQNGNRAIHFARVDGHGRKIGDDSKIGEEVPVTKNTVAPRVPSLVWTGSEYGVAWAAESSGSREIYFARLDAEGKVIGNAVQITDGAHRYPFEPSLVWNGTEYGLVWRENDKRLYFIRINAEGQKLGDPIAITVNSAVNSAAQLVWNGVRYAVVWSDEYTLVSTDIEDGGVYFDFVDPDHPRVP